MTRERRRAKTDRLDAAMLMRVFLGWLRGERGHCRMVAIPTLEEEDAKRPSRERESLVGEKTRIINRMKGALARLGIRSFKPELRRAPQRLADLRAPGDLPLPANMLEEMQRDMARLALVREQIGQSNGPAYALNKLHRPGLTRWWLCWHVLSASGSRRRTCWSRGTQSQATGSPGGSALCRLTGSPDESGSKRREEGWPRRATPAYGEA